MHRRGFMRAAALLAAMTPLEAHARGRAYHRHLTSPAPIDGVEMADAVRRGQITSALLVVAAIARLERANAKLNCVAYPNYDRARAAAAHPHGQLAGVPTLTKELAEEAGLPWSEGCRGWRNRVGTTDAAAPARMREVGLISIARSTSPEFGLMPTTESLLHGPTRNPWNLARSSGGSSGGSAAAVACGAVPFAHASDGGGSVRIPAANCGLVGLKVSRTRWVGERERVHVTDFSVSAGCVSRTVRDTAAWLAAMEDSGPGARYRPVGLVTGPSPRRLRVGLALSNGLRDPDTDVAAVFAATQRLLVRLGHKPVDAPLPYDPHALGDAFNLLWGVGAARNVSKLGKSLGRAPGGDNIEPYTAVLAEQGARAGKPAVDAAVALLTRLEAAYAAQFDAYDVLLTPVLGSPAVPLGWFGVDVAADTIRQRLTDYVGWTPVQNAAGVPAIALPMGMSSGGLPVGMQFVARPGAERVLLELAYELEREVQWHRLRPPLWVG